MLLGVLLPHPLPLQATAPAAVIEESGMVSHAGAVLSVRSALGAGCISTVGVNLMLAPAAQPVDTKALPAALAALAAQEAKVRVYVCLVVLLWG